MLGLLTPLGSLAVLAVMSAAVIAVHAPKGPGVTDGGYEYNLVLATAAFTLACLGPGGWSADKALGLSMHGVLWGIAALAAGLAGGIIAVLSGHSYEAERRPGTSERPTAA